jgi:hypothetical protein
LDGVSRAGLFAITAEDATREVDAEEVGITPPAFVFGRLERDTINRTGDCTEVARDAALASIGIA